MKKLSLVLTALALVAFAGPSLAAPAGKATILHCGCVWDGVEASMVYTEISVNSRTKGHDEHTAESIDSCLVNLVDLGGGIFEPVFADFIRTGADCQVSGPALGDPIGFCSEQEVPPVAGDGCGQLFDGQ